jgi:hypothetical protein
VNRRTPASSPSRHHLSCSQARKRPSILEYRPQIHPIPTANTPNTDRKYTQYRPQIHPIPTANTPNKPPLQLHLPLPVCPWSVSVTVRHPTQLQDTNCNIRTASVTTFLRVVHRGRGEDAASPRCENSLVHRGRPHRLSEGICNYNLDWPVAVKCDSQLLEWRVSSTAP